MSDNRENKASGPFVGRVLVAEDEEVNRYVAAGLLRMLGIDPKFAENGTEAVEKAAACEYDLILMDVQMPDIDGIEATTMIREGERTGDRKRASIVALTAFAASRDRERCLEAGMDDFITKPLMRDNLVDTLERWLGGADDRSQAEDLAGDGPVVSAGVLDADRLAVLARSMRSMPGGLRSVLVSYLESLARLPATILTAQQDDDAEALARAAHSLKSNSAAIGALDLSALCADLERTARDGGLAAIGGLIFKIENEIPRVRLAVEAELDGIPK